MKRNWREWVLQGSAARAVAVAAGASVLMSVALMLLLTALLKVPRGPHFGTYLAMTVIIPLLVLVPVSSVIVHLLREVDTARRALQEQAWLDELTGLVNRRRFAELARLELERARRSGQPLALALVDIDDFKRVNDAHGHAAGDALLAAVARAAAGALRATDLSARWGGEEFVLLLVGTHAEAALPVLERLRAAVHALPPPGTGGGERGCSVSIGVATWRPDEAFDAVVGRADRAMYRAKQSGKDRVTVDSDR